MTSCVWKRGWAGSGRARDTEYSKQTSTELWNSTPLLFYLWGMQLNPYPLILHRHVYDSASHTICCDEHDTHVCVRVCNFQSITDGHVALLCVTITELAPRATYQGSLNSSTSRSVRVHWSLAWRLQGQVAFKVLEWLLLGLSYRGLAWSADHVLSSATPKGSASLLGRNHSLLFYPSLCVPSDF